MEALLYPRTAVSLAVTVYPGSDGLLVGVITVATIIVAHNKQASKKFKLILLQ